MRPAERETEEVEILTIDVDRPHRPVVSVIRAEPLSVVRVPGIHNRILGAREQQVTLRVELDLCE